MKFFLLATLVIAAVVAEPEAKPEADAKSQYFGTYGYNAYSPYTSYASYSPYTAGYASAYSSPYYGYGSHFVGKREAEAEPQYYGAYGYNAYSPYTAYSSYSPYTAGYASAYASPYTTGYSHYIGKREAEAESKPELVYTDGTFHTNVANLQKGVNQQYVKPYGAVYNTVPAAYQQPALAYAAAPVAVQQPYLTGYSRLYKREAEAEPQYYYGGAYSPYSYGSGYSSYGAYPYASYGSYGGYRSGVYYG